MQLWQLVVSTRDSKDIEKDSCVGIDYYFTLLPFCAKTKIQLQNFLLLC